MRNLPDRKSQSAAFTGSAIRVHFGRTPGCNRDYRHADRLALAGPAAHRQAAEGAACLSNLRQLSMAIFSFSTDHLGRMPARGGFNLYKMDPVTYQISQIVSDSDPYVSNPADWIAWQRIKDPVTGIPDSAANQNITYSAIAPYLGGQHITTTTGDAANNVNATLDAIFRCPADNIASRPSHADTSHGYYRYSYAINIAYSNPVFAFANQVAGGNWPTGARFDGNFNGLITSIHAASEKVLLICEDEQTLNDAFVLLPIPMPGIPAAAWMPFPRGTMPISPAPTSLMNTTQVNVDCYGNVAFCDGHSELFTRKDALRGRYSGNPNPDAPGF